MLIKERLVGKLERWLDKLVQRAKLTRTEFLSGFESMQTSLFRLSSGGTDRKLFLVILNLLLTNSLLFCLCLWLHLNWFIYLC
jgi:hypothetical protein